MDNTWLAELGKFLDNQPNELKSHPKFYGNEGYTFMDKSFPTAEQADDLI